MEKKILNLIKGKPKPYTIAPEASVYAALELMANYDIGFLVVMDRKKMVGVISERDYARKVDLNAKDSRNTKVHEIMSTNVYSIDSEKTFEDAMAIMTENHIRHLPVFRSGRLTSIISMGDVVKACLSNQKETIDFLEDIELDK